MRNSQPAKLVCLSNVFDQNYHDSRAEEIDRCLSSAKRRDLFQCLEKASGKELVVLSSPPKAKFRREGKWLRPITTRFSTHRQLFCPNWDAPKLRIPLSWFFYVRHTLRHTRSGDLVLFDNYEFIYVVAALFLKLLRRVRFILDYEDGKHLIDTSWRRWLSATAEFFGKRLLSAALLAHPALGQRLLNKTPRLLVPGFISKSDSIAPKQSSNELNLLYSGTLDRTRGVDLLLEALPLLPANGWHLHVSGTGGLENPVAMAQKERPEKITFHGSLSNAAYAELLTKCHVGLNCQRVSDPISSVTFPSKIFSYFSARLLVISSRASDVPAICGDACQYFESETPSDLAQAITRVLKNYSTLAQKDLTQSTIQDYTMDGTIMRMRHWLKAASLL
ncbi:MAG: glycosyltransferase [Verrucomicrobiota bacterium]